MPFDTSNHQDRFVVEFTKNEQILFGWFFELKLSNLYSVGGQNSGYRIDDSYCLAFAWHNHWLASSYPARKHFLMLSWSVFTNKLIALFVGKLIMKDL